MGLEASHFIGEISVGIIELYNIWYTVIYIIINYNTSCMYIGGFHASQVWWHPWVHAMKTLLTFAVGICILQPMWKMRRPSTFHREKNQANKTELKHLCTTQKKGRKTDQRNIWILWNPLTFIRWMFAHHISDPDPKACCNEKICSCQDQNRTSWRGSLSSGSLYPQENVGVLWVMVTLCRSELRGWCWSDSDA